MGTNYYWETPASEKCSLCGRSDAGEYLHIGKSSGGWCFLLHVYPDEGINDLEDWAYKWQGCGYIRDEYGRTMSPPEMRGVITDRRHLGPPWSEGTLALNHAVQGPNGLARCEIDGGHCIGHGEGAWDFIVGEFS